MHRAKPSNPRLTVSYNISEGIYKGVHWIEHFSNHLAPFFGTFSRGDEFCVKTSAELQNALTEAASNEEDDIIKVIKGTYIGNFFFDSSEGKNLTLLGGYSRNCASRTIDPAKTILDGNNLGSVLFLDNSSGGDIYVEGFKTRKGFTTDDGGGIYAASYSYGMAGNITITDNIILINAASNGSGIYASTSNEHDCWKKTTGDMTGKSSEEIWAKQKAEVILLFPTMKPHPGLKPRVSALWHNLVMASTDRGCIF